MSDIIKRLDEYAGLNKDKDRCPSNPCMTVREAIEVANELARLRAENAALKAELLLEKGAIKIPVPRKWQVNYSGAEHRFSLMHHEFKIEDGILRLYTHWAISFGNCGYTEVDQTYDVTLNESAEVTFTYSECVKCNPPHPCDPICYMVTKQRLAEIMKGDTQ